MKIIHRGETKSERIWVGTCRSCGSIAEANEYELNDISKGTQRDPEDFCWMMCPVCSSGPYGGMLFYRKK